MNPLAAAEQRILEHRAKAMYLQDEADRARAITVVETLRHLRNVEERMADFIERSLERMRPQIKGGENDDQSD